MGEVEESKVRAIGAVLVDTKRPLKERFRALFTLRSLGGTIAIECIAAAFTDSSALLKHECAYCLGQMQDTRAVACLICVLEDVSQEPMVRHEAGEALGAIGTPEVINVLRKYENDPVVEVAETCQLALRRIEWLNSPSSESEDLSSNPYSSVDPAPPAPSLSVSELKSTLLNEDASLFDRYRAMFTLRNYATEESVIALAEGLQHGSALFRHEVAYVLGQIQSKAAAPQLLTSLRDLNENEMVRHECAEALGSIANSETCAALKDFLGEEERRVVRESCEVALDMCDYESSKEFQYANMLTNV